MSAVVAELQRDGKWAEFIVRTDACPLPDYRFPGSVRMAERSGHAFVLGTGQDGETAAGQ
jgi:hypothetical protein